MLKVTNLQYMHMFIDQKEYVLSPQSISEVGVGADFFNIKFKIENDQAAQSLADFFRSLNSEDLLFMFGFFNKTTDQNDMISITCTYVTPSVHNGVLTLKFLKKEVN